jgi:hypothetical protein
MIVGLTVFDLASVKFKILGDIIIKYYFIPNSHNVANKLRSEKDISHNVQQQPGRGKAGTNTQTFHSQDVFFLCTILPYFSEAGIILQEVFLKQT